MENETVVRRGDQFGSFLNAFGVIAAVLGVAVAIWVAMKAHGAQQNDSDTIGVARTFSYGLALAIGVGSLVVGCLLGWAGYLVRILAAIHARLGTPPRSEGSNRSTSQQVPVPPQSLPDFGTTFRA